MLDQERKEQRKHPRVMAHLPVKYRKLSEPWSAMQDATVTCNISEGGVNFRAKEFMPKAGRIVMEVDLPGQKPLKAISRVAWIVKSRHGEDYSVGNQFLEMSRKDKETLFSYIEGLVKGSV